MSHPASILDKPAKEKQTEHLAQQPVRKMTHQELTETKESLSQRKKVSEMVEDFFRNFKEMSGRERMERIVKILATAAMGLLFSGKKEVEKIREIVAHDEMKKEVSHDTDERKKKSKCIDPCLVGDIPSGVEPIVRNTKDIQKIAEDHQHNAQLIELLPKSRGQLDKLTKLYEENMERYKRVSEATDLPPALIFAIHFMEGSCNFNGYLHNGQKLGTVTTYVPAGILFQHGQWEEAAIHALGGNIKDANGKPSRKTFQKLRESLGINKNTTDMGKLMAFTESYNGLGYRYRNLRSCYVYGGTNLLSRGRFVADHKFDPNGVSQRIGTAAIMMGLHAHESGSSLRVAETNQLRGDSGRRLALVPAKKKAKTGELTQTLATTFSGVEVHGGIQELESAKHKAKGVGGQHVVEAIRTPSGYSRRGTESLPTKTAVKLRRISDALLADSRMPMFTGISMNVDGVEVMMVKEEHIHSMKKYGQEDLSDHYYKPHKGVSYLMKAA